LQLTDVDRSDFLHRMTTNNINALKPGHSAVTVLTSPTARILFVFTVVNRGDDLILLPAPGQTQTITRHLRGQIFFMDKVKVTDVSEELKRLRLIGPQAAKALASLGVETRGASADDVLAQDDLRVVVQPHHELPGYELIVPASRQADVVAALARGGARAVTDPAAYEVRRIELGRPAVNAELTEDYNPLEVGLGWTCAENKGCYTGQEIIARQINYDRVTRSLVGLTAAEPMTPGAAVIVDGRNMGQVTSAAYSVKLDTPVALAVVKRPANTPGTQARVDGIPAQVVALPFVQD
jgi:folate-binding protein YgfZ